MQKLYIAVVLALAFMLTPFATIAAQGNKGGKSKDNAKHGRDKKGAQVADTTAIIAPPPATDLAEIESRLMMVNAMLELNQAMLEGVKASIDTLNLPENDLPTKDKDLQLLRSKRLRDKTLLMPYLEHIQDSLGQEITSLATEKKDLEGTLNPPVAPVVIKTDTLVSGNDMVVYQTTLDKESGETKKSVQNIITKDGDLTKTELAELSEAPKAKSKKKPKEKEKTYFPTDTIMVFDMASTKAKPEPERKHSKYDTALLAKANDTTLTLKIKVPNSNDSIIIKPVKKPRKGQEETVVALKTDTAQQLTPVIPDGTRTLTSQDSIQLIKAQFFLQRAQRAMGDKSYRNAEQYLEKSIELYPNYYEARLTRADLAVQTGDYSTALSEYKVCEQLDSSKPQLFYGMGVLAAKLKKKSEAMNYLTKAIKANPGYVEALMQRAALLTESKRFIEAIIDYDKVIKAEITYFQAYKARGTARVMIKDYANAADDFTRFLIFEPNDPNVYYLRGLARIANNELMDGCLDLSTASEKGYRDAEKAIKKNCE